MEKKDKEAFKELMLFKNQNWMPRKLQIAYCFLFWASVINILIGLVKIINNYVLK